MNRKDQCCGNCNAFMVNDDPNAPKPQGGQPPQGFCRAGPPTPMRTVVQVSSAIDLQRRMAEAIQSLIAPVTATGWCRQWEPEGHNHWAAKEID